MTSEFLGPYRVSAFNTAHDSENKIHDDAVARRFGFGGGLVPGVDVYGYMTHLPVLRWGRAWLEHGTAALMLQEFVSDSHHASPIPAQVGAGVGLNFICRDALAFYHAMRERGIATQRPFVGNQMWVTSLRDPDGYSLHFESPTDAPEETEYED